MSRDRRPRHLRLPRLPRRLPGTPDPCLEVLSALGRGSAGEPIELWPRPPEMEAFGRAWIDRDAFFVAEPSRRSWSVVLITDFDSSIHRRDYPFESHPDMASALNAAADLNWFIGRVPTREWHLPPAGPEPSSGAPVDPPSEAPAETPPETPSP